MKKTAIILTGQLRTWRMTRSLIRRCFPRADFFLSIDLDNTKQCLNENPTTETKGTEAQEAVDYFQARRWFVSTGYSFPQSRLFPTSEFSVPSAFDPPGELPEEQLYLPSPHQSVETRVRVSSLHLVFEQYYYVWRGFLLLEEYSGETGETYDYVIRLRFDQLLFDYPLMETLKDHLEYSPENVAFVEALDVPSYSEDRFTVLEGQIGLLGSGTYKNYRFANDQFWILTFRDRYALMSFFLELPNIIGHCVQTRMYPSGGAGIEHFFLWHLFNQKLSIVHTPNQGISGVFIRGHRSRGGN